MKQLRSMATTGTQAIDRAALLLTRVVQSDEPISFTELCAESGFARSTTSRLLAALEANYLLERDTNGAYSSGPLFALYAARHDPWSQIARLADPVLREVNAETGETVNLAVARGQTVVQIAQVDSTYVLGVRDWTQVSVPAHTSALGKVLYAFDALPLPGEPLERLTRNSVGSMETLRRQLADIRRRGYAATREELEVGLNAVAAPVRGADRRVIAALGISGPTARLGRNLDEMGKLMITYGDELSNLMQRRVLTEGVA